MSLLVENRQKLKAEILPVTTVSVKRCKSVELFIFGFTVLAIFHFLKHLCNCILFYIYVTMQQQTFLEEEWSLLPIPCLIAHVIAHKSSITSVCKFRGQICSQTSHVLMQLLEVYTCQCTMCWCSGAVWLCVIESVDCSTQMYLARVLSLVGIVIPNGSFF